MLIENATFAVERGEVVAILGRNGVGKTTLLRTIAGVRAPDAGTVTIDGREVSRLSSAQRARIVAHMAGDDLFLDRLSVRDVVAAGRYAHHRWWQWHEERADGAHIERALNAVQMAALASRRFVTLSSGERQRIWLALALAQEAPALLLDEPTSHLDVRVAQDILELLRSQARGGKTVVCVLHDVNEAAEFADRILLLGSRRVLAFDTPQTVLTSDVLEEAYDVRMERIHTPGGGLRVFVADGKRR